MKRLKRAPFADLVHAAEEGSAERLFAKAVTASMVAKAALSSSESRAAYAVKQACLDRAQRVSPNRFRRTTDPVCGRWVVWFKGSRGLHAEPLEAG